MTTCAQAIKTWEAANNSVAEDAEYIKLYCQMPPITKMDASLNTLKSCERLALSTNSIDRIIPLNGMVKLKILSLGRNQIKKIEKLEDLAGTLEELWLSYNQISSLDGLSSLSLLTTLYLSNNLIKAWNELDKLFQFYVMTYVHLITEKLYQKSGLVNLRDVLFVGNPIYDDMPREQARIEVLKRLPNVAKIDGDMVKPTERELAAGIAAT